MLLASLLPAAATSHCSGLIYVTQNLRFKAPVFVDQDVVALLECTAATGGKIRMETRIVRVAGMVVVVDGKALMLLPAG